MSCGECSRILNRLVLKNNPDIPPEGRASYSAKITGKRTLVSGDIAACTQVSSLCIY